MLACQYLEISRRGSYETTWIFLWLDSSYLGNVLPIFFCDITLWSPLDCCCAHACKKPINHHIGVENENCNLCAKHMHVHVNLDQSVFRIQLI
jgi:hypothetical protein